MNKYRIIEQILNNWIKTDKLNKANGSFGYKHKFKLKGILMNWSNQEVNFATYR